MKKTALYLSVLLRLVGVCSCDAVFGPSLFGDSWFDQYPDGTGGLLTGSSYPRLDDSGLTAASSPLQKFEWYPELATLGGPLLEASNSFPAVPTSTVLLPQSAALVQSDQAVPVTEYGIPPTFLSSGGVIASPYSQHIAAHLDPATQFSLPDYTYVTDLPEYRLPNFGQQLMTSLDGKRSLLHTNKEFGSHAELPLVDYVTEVSPSVSQELSERAELLTAVAGREIIIDPTLIEEEVLLPEYDTLLEASPVETLLHYGDDSLYLTDLAEEIVVPPLDAEYISPFLSDPYSNTLQSEGLLLSSPEHTIQFQALRNEVPLAPYMEYLTETPVPFMPADSDMSFLLDDIPLESFTYAPPMSNLPYFSGINPYPTALLTGDNTQFPNFPLPHQAFLSPPEQVPFQAYPLAMIPEQTLQSQFMTVNYEQPTIAFDQYPPYLSTEADLSPPWYIPPVVAPLSSMPLVGVEFPSESNFPELLMPPTVAPVSYQTADYVTPAISSYSLIQSPTSYQPLTGDTFRPILTYDSEKFQPLYPPPTASLPYTSILSVPDDYRPDIIPNGIDFLPLESEPYSVSHPFQTTHLPPIYQPPNPKLSAYELPEQSFPLQFGSTFPTSAYFSSVPADILGNMVAKENMQFPYVSANKPLLTPVSNAFQSVLPDSPLPLEHNPVIDLSFPYSATSNVGQPPVLSTTGSFGIVKDTQFQPTSLELNGAYPLQYTSPTDYHFSSQSNNLPSLSKTRYSSDSTSMEHPFSQSMNYRPAAYMPPPSYLSNPTTQNYMNPLPPASQPYGMNPYTGNNFASQFGGTSRSMIHHLIGAGPHAEPSVFPHLSHQYHDTIIEIPHTVEYYTPFHEFGYHWPISHPCTQAQHSSQSTEVAPELVGNHEYFPSPTPHKLPLLMSPDRSSHFPTMSSHLLPELTEYSQQPLLSGNTPVITNPENNILPPSISPAHLKPSPYSASTFTPPEVKPMPSPQPNKNNLQQTPLDFSLRPEYAGYPYPQHIIVDDPILLPQYLPGVYDSSPTTYRNIQRSPSQADFSTMEVRPADDYALPIVPPTAYPIYDYNRPFQPDSYSVPVTDYIKPPPFYPTLMPSYNALPLPPSSEYTPVKPLTEDDPPPSSEVAVQFQLQPLSEHPSQLPILLQILIPAILYTSPKLLYSHLSELQQSVLTEGLYEPKIFAFPLPLPYTTANSPYDYLLDFPQQTLLPTTSLSLPNVLHQEYLSVQQENLPLFNLKQQQGLPTTSMWPNTHTDWTSQPYRGQEEYLPIQETSKPSPGVTSFDWPPAYQNNYLPGPDSPYTSAYGFKNDWTSQQPILQHDFPPLMETRQDSFNNFTPDRLLENPIHQQEYLPLLGDQKTPSSNLQAQTASQQRNYLQNYAPLLKEQQTTLPNLQLDWVSQSPILARG